MPAKKKISSDPVKQANSLANLNRGSSRRPREHLTKQEKIFCFFYADNGSARRSAELSGYPEATGYYLIKKPAIKEFIKVAGEKMLDQALEYVSKRTHISVEFLDRELIRAVKQKNGHAKNEALDLGYTRVGILQRKGTTNVSATANAAAASVQSGSTMKQIYKSKWLQDTENQIERELIQERDQPLLAGNTETSAE